MKKRILIYILAGVLSIPALMAQGKRSVEVTDLQLVRADKNVTVSFTLHADKRATKSDYNLVVNPLLQGGATQRQLPSIVVRGKRSKVTDARHELATGARRYQQEPVYMTPGSSINYTATIAYEDWMRGGKLTLEGISVGCCSATEVTIGLIANNILYDDAPVIETQIVEMPVVIPRQSAAEKLTQQYPFIAPIAELEKIEQAEREPQTGTDYSMPLYLGYGSSALAPQPNLEQRIIEGTREGSISIYFKQGVRVIDRNHNNNNKYLVELISAVRALDAAEDARIKKIIIAGFASPEGDYNINERLAYDRAVAVKNFLISNSDVDPQTIQIYNGGVDWTGLKNLISESDLYQKRQLIDIINNTPIWDSYRKVGRLGELMRVEWGNPYRYIAREFFPKLRQAAYIKVYYENK